MLGVSHAASRCSSVLPQDGVSGVPCFKLLFVLFVAPAPLAPVKPSS